MPRIHLSESALTAGVVTELTDASTVTWDASSGLAYKLTLNGDRTIENPTNLLAGGLYILELIQGEGGSFAPVWGDAFRFSDGISPDISTAAGSIDILFFFYDGAYMNLTAVVVNVAIPIAAPSDLTASTDQQWQVTLNWVNNATDATSITVQRDDGLGFATIASGLDPGLTSYTDITASEGDFPYRIFALKGATASGYSNTANGHSDDFPAPSGFTASNNQVGQVTLNWTINSDQATTTHVQRSDGLDFFDIAVIAVPTAVYVDVIEAGIYDYRVISAIGANNLSDPSVSQNGTSLP